MIPMSPSASGDPPKSDADQQRAQPAVILLPTGDDSVVISAVTPVLLLFDTATFHYVPVAARIVTVSGCAHQVSSEPLRLPLIVEVQDAVAPYRGGTRSRLARQADRHVVAPTTANTDLTGRAQTILTAGVPDPRTATATGLTGSADLQWHGDNRRSQVPTTVASPGQQPERQREPHLANPLVVLVSDQARQSHFGRTVCGPRATESSAPTSNTNASGQASINLDAGSANQSDRYRDRIGPHTSGVQATTLSQGPGSDLAGGVFRRRDRAYRDDRRCFDGPAGAGESRWRQEFGDGNLTVAPATLNIPQGATAGTPRSPGYRAV